MSARHEFLQWARWQTVVLWLRRCVVPVPFWAWVVALLWISLASDFGLGIYDEGSLLVGARSVAHGGVPIRDFWTAYPPGIFWLVGLALRIFGEQLIVNRFLHDGIAMGVCVAGYHVIAALVGRGRWALVGFLSLALYVGALRTSYGYPPVLCVLLGFWSLLEMFGTGGPLTRERLRRGGVAAGLCAILRYDIALYLVVASVGGGVLLIARLRGPGVRRREVVRAATDYLSGFLGPALLAYAVLIALAGVGPVYAQLVDFPLHVFPRVRGLPLDRPFGFLFTAPRTSWETTWFLIELRRVLVYVGLVAVGLGAVGALARGSHKAAPLLLSVSLLGLAFFNQFRVRSDAVHGWPLVVTALVVGTALLAWTTASRHRRVQVFGWASAVAWAVVLVPGMVHLGWERLHARYLEPTVAVDSPSAAGIRIASGDAVNGLLADLRTRAPGERYIFSGAVDHDQVVMNDAMIYFLAGRLSPTPYPDLVPGVIDTVAVQQDIVQALDARDVKTVVLFDYVSAEPNDSSRTTHADILDRMLTAKFRQVAQYPPYYRVLRRIEP